MPANDSLMAQLRAAAARVAASYGLEVFDLQFRRESIGWVLRVILDRVPKETGLAPQRLSAPAAAAPSESSSRGAAARGGGAPRATSFEDSVTIQDCQRVSHDLSALLDVEDEWSAALGEKYTLEVSSPGLDRPLRGESDFRRFEGRLTKIVTAEPVEGQTHFAGRLSGVESGVVLVAEGRRVHRVPLASVKRARLDVEV
jgi:ribosome maturation factor RimP